MSVFFSPGVAKMAAAQRSNIQRAIAKDHAHKYKFLGIEHHQMASSSQTAALCERIFEDPSQDCHVLNKRNKSRKR